MAWKLEGSKNPARRVLRNLAGGPAGGEGQGRLARSGCGRVIADVVRLDKGHTEGLEPRITEELIKLMVSAPGGKLRTGETGLGADSVPG